VGNNSWLAAIFITGNNADGYMLNSVALGMADATGNPSGFTVMVYAQSGNPAGAFPGSSLGTLDGSLNPVINGTYTYDAPSNPTLSPSTDYFIVLTAGTMVANGAYEWSKAGTYSYNPSDGWGVGSNEGTIGVFLSSVNDGLSWNGNQGNLQFDINAAPIPEPSAISLILIGSGVLIYVRTRNKKHFRI
jgi:hypothetical protein